MYTLSSRFITLAFIAVALTGCKTVSTYPIDEKPLKANMDDRIIGDWKFEEDTNHANFYRVQTAVPPHQYHIQFYNRSGTNRTYESNMFFSRIGDVRFLNIYYFEPPTHRKPPPLNNDGYTFLRILDVNNDFTKMTACMVYDTTMRSLTNSAAVRKRITENLNNPKYFYDTVHLYKVLQ